MENWKNIKNYEGVYQISDLGNVKSLEKKQIKKLKQGEVVVTLKEKLLTPRKVGNNLRTSRYLSVALYDNNKKRKDYFIHRLVAEHFINEIGDDMVVNHKDFNGENNNVNNLEIISQRDNTIHYHSFENDVYNKELLIDLHHNKKISLRGIGKMFNTTHKKIKNIMGYYNIEIIRHSINQYV